MKTAPLIAVFLALAGLDLAAALLALEMIGASHSLPAVPTAAAVHFLVAAVGALAVVFFPGAKERAGYRTVAMLAGCLCLLTPVIGPLAAAGVLCGIYQRRHTPDETEQFVVGNPMQAKRRSPLPTSMPVSEPLALSLGYGHLHGQRLAAPLLRRVGTVQAIELLRRLFLQPDARTQLYAQSALSSILEKTETQLIQRRDRVEADPENPWESESLAKTLLQTAYLGIHPPSEQKTMIREAITLLDYAISLRPSEAQFYFDKASALIRLGDKTSLDQVPNLYGHILASPEGQRFSDQLDCDYFAAIGNWSRTSSTVKRFADSGNSTQLNSACREFWTCPIPS